MTLSGQKIGCPSGGALVYRPVLDKSMKRIRTLEHRIGRCVPGGGDDGGESSFGAPA